MTRDLYKGLQCSKSREEVEQGYSEDSYTVDESQSDKLDRLLDNMSEGVVNYENTEDTFIEVNPHLKTSYKAKDYTVKLGDIDITDGWVEHDSWTLVATGNALDELAKIPVRDIKPLEVCTEHFPKYYTDIEVMPVSEGSLNKCEYNDCGWCYYKGDKNSNDNNGQCNNSESCEVIND